MVERCLICGSKRSVWGSLYFVLLCTAYFPQLLSAATLNQDGNCTITYKNNPTTSTDCQDDSKHNGKPNTIIIEEGEVINVVASDSNKTVIAIEGGHHRDTIINHGEIYLQVNNSGEVIPYMNHDAINAFYGEHDWHKDSDKQKHKDKKPGYWLFNLGNISPDAIGITGGYGNDIIENYGLLDVSIITALTDEAGNAQSYSIGITGNQGNDILYNEGQLNVTSTAEVLVTDVTFGLVDDGDARRKAMAVAKGITGDKGHDKIINKGQLDVSANATVKSSEFNLTLLGGPLEVDAGSEAWAGAIGLEGGKGNDHIYNDGTLTVSANALADSDNVSIDLIDIPNGESVSAPLSANAMAIGIVGGEGNDHIYNSGTLTVTADAKADALDVQVTGLSLSAGGANTTSKTVAFGIHSGKGKDEIHNDGTIIVNTNDDKANTSSGRFNLTVFDLSFIPPIFGVENEQVATTATSEAIGILAGSGDDKIKNTGSLLVQSNANVDIDALTISLLGLGSDVNRTAEATVNGITGEHGNDYIKNSGQLDATANATLDVLSISVDLVGGATDIDGKNQALANAVGIDGGEGNDHIFNSGSTTATANASVTSSDVGISLLSALQGENIRADIEVNTDASGILGGDGHDHIGNKGSFTVTADAKVDALDMDFSAVDISSGSLSTKTQASAMGIDGGKGKSKIYNGGDATIDSNATTKTNTFAFTLLDLSLIPDITGTASAADNSTTANADATGIKTGYENDKIVNDGGMTVTADAVTETFDMSMSIDGVSNLTDLSDFTDFFFDEPVIKASTESEASVIGITSGHGHDEIYNHGTLFANATANVTATRVGVDIPAPDIIPISLPGVDTTEVETAAEANAMGIVTGEGHDSVHNDGSVTSKASATANSVSVNATLDVPLPDGGDDDDGGGLPSYSIEANLVDVGAKSDAEAVGISTGKGHDYIYSIGNVTAEVDTKANANTIDATVAYSDDNASFDLSLANATTEGTGKAIGITSGDGDDWLHTAGNITADSFVDTLSLTVAVDVQALKDTTIALGGSVSKANTEAEAISIGMELGAGNDDLHNEGLITAKAHNNADADGVGVEVSIPAGDKFGIFGQGTWVSTDTIATSFADGILGGEGKDYIYNSGTVTADAFADPDSLSIAANAAGTKKGASIGIALTQAKSEGTATSNGIVGGKDQDKLINTGTVDVDAKTDVDAVSVSASLNLTDKGVALTGTAADGSTNATSTATGMTGDEAEDVVKNKGTVDVLADAHAETYSVSVAASGASKGVALGLALSRATSEADANSKGISGGAHDDELYSSGLIKSKAKSHVIAGTISFAGGGTGKGLSVQGAAADGSTRGTASASGISGEDGYDYINNSDTVDVHAKVEADSVSVAVTGSGVSTGATLGIALGKATSEAEAESSGISGGTGSDKIISSGLVKTKSESKTLAGSIAAAGAGGGKGVVAQGAGVDATSNGYATTQGITGQEGKDIIISDSVDVLADADTTTFGVAVTATGTGTGLTFGVGLARATAEADANSIGISGGEDNDKLVSKELVKSYADSKVMAGSGGLSIGGTGKGVTITGAAVDAATIGHAKAQGSSGGDGKDLIINHGMVDVKSTADTTSVGVAVTANGTGAGVSLGIGLARATSEAETDSSGISGGADDDKIINDGMVKSHAISIVNAGSGGLAIAGAPKGVAIAGAAADASTVGTANATGISGDSGSDEIYNKGDLDVLADVDATSVSVGAAATVAGAGVGLGVSLAQSDTNANATATGISLGGLNEEDDHHHSKKRRKEKDQDHHSDHYAKTEHHDYEDDDYNNDKSCNKDGKHHDSHHHGKCKKTEYLENFGNITAKAETDADSTSVSVQLGFGGAGVQAGAALADASTTSTTIANSIEGSNHKDIISNHGNINAISDAGSTTVSVGVSFNAEIKGAALSVALTDATANATATSTGIAGLNGNDDISNQGSVTATSIADTNAVGVSVAASVAFVPLSAAKADNDATSVANAFGIDGGEGHDYLFSSGSILANATSDADGISVAFAPIGVSLVGADITADANAVGMVGDDGNDTIYQSETASLTATTTSTSTGTVVSATLIGGAGTIIDDNNSTALSQSTGIAGGAGYDEIHNLGSINSNASATANGTSVGVSLVGAAFSDITTTATSSATAIDTADENDYVYNHGTITVDAVSTGEGTSVAAGLIGYFDADASTFVNANTSGIHLGTGNDEIRNMGEINVGARTNANLTAGSGGLIGAASSTASITSSAIASGIVGGEGDDLIINKAAVTVGATEADPWMSRLTSTSFSLSLIGAADAGTEITSNTQTVGLDGGSGKDHIFNVSELDVTASSYSTSSSTTFALAGVAGSKGTITTDAQAIGMNAGDGPDKLFNKGDIDVKASTFANSDTSSIAIFGGANTNSGIIGSATATGMAGGGHKGDQIANLGFIDVLATSLATANGDSFSLIGGASADAFITADSNANGIIGSQGNDYLYNNGSIEIVAASTANAGQDASVGLVGDVTAGADIVSNAIVRGMASDGGNDKVYNEGDIDVDVTASGNANSDSQTGVFEGDGDSDSNGDVNATGIGFELADGNNTLHNTGTMLVNASATMNTSATADGSDFADGNGVADAGSAARSLVYGVWADEGNNHIENNGDITLFSNTLTTAGTNADGDGFFGFGDGRANSHAGNGEVSPFAAGVRLGDGDHHINNHGKISLNVTGTATANARSDGDLVTSSANSAATASMGATVYGIQVGDGEQKLYNTGDILAEATVHATAYAIANPSADPDGYGNADATTSTRVDGTGIATGSGHHKIINAGNITLRLKANPNVSAANRDANANGDGDARFSTADTIATAIANGSGISTNSNESWIKNQGTILVDTHANAAPRTSSASDWTADTRGTGKSTVTASGIGIVLSGDDNSLNNEGQITVNTKATATPYVKADTWGWGSNADATSKNTSSAIADGLLVTGNNNEISNHGDILVSGLSNTNSVVRAEATDGPDANGDVTSDSHATAIANVNGIRSVDGADWIYNHGRIEVAANSDGRMDSKALGGDIDGDARAYATGNARAFAYGIRSDQIATESEETLDDFIVNKADIVVNSSATAFALARADEDAGGTSSELASGTAVAVANSYGIYTGDGNDTIINRDLIDVSATANASVDVDTEDEDREYSSYFNFGKAVAIHSGDGDDVIKHLGTIVTSLSLINQNIAGTAIDTGAGNDSVFLGENSSTIGNILLGDNDDTLHIFETPVVNGSISGGSDTDTVVFYGEGTFSNPLTNFENTVKEDSGTYKLTELAPMQQITVKQGVLEIDNDYEFAAGSTYMPSVSSGDGHGKLVINGAVNFSAASINVMKGRGHHLDGEKQTVLYASEGILDSMSFNNIKLPEKTPLLEFHHEITADEIQVSTSVESFKTVASTNNQHIIANYMDGLLPNAEGNISEALGEIQAMKAGGHNRAFSSVNPEPYVNTQQALESSIKNYTSTLLQRTRGLRNIKQYNSFVQPGFFTGEQDDLLVKDQPADSLSEVLNLSSKARRPYGAWVKTYLQDGQLDQTANNTGFDFDSNGYAFGYDKWLDRERVVGISLGINETDITADNNRTRSDIDSQLVSLYTGYVTDTGFIDGAISYGYNTYNTQRDVTIGTTNNTVFSEHNGDVYGASVVGGFFFLVNTWDLETYAALQYQQQDEDGFQESGSGGVSLNVDPRKSDLLSSEVGLRFGKQFKKRKSSLFTEFGIAWIHEYTDDNSVEASFVDSPNSSFTVYSQDIDNDGALINLGLSYTNKNGLTGTAEYRTDIRDGYSDQTFFANIQYQFD